MKYILALAAFGVHLSTLAQVNDKGTFHFAVGVSGGGHGTQYIENYTVPGVSVPVRIEESDGAATVLFPIDVQYGVARPVSLGLFVEPGSYLDSSATRSNSLVMYGFQPRAYIIDRDRFTWMGSLQIGSSSLKIDDNENGVSELATYKGPFFGLSSGVGFYFGEHFGLQVHARYMSTAFVLKEFEKDGAAQDLSDFQADLNTTGFALQASLAVRF